MTTPLKQINNNASSFFGFISFSLFFSSLFLASSYHRGIYKFDHLICFFKIDILLEIHICFFVYLLAKACSLFPFVGPYAFTEERRDKYTSSFFFFFLSAYYTIEKKIYFSLLGLFTKFVVYRWEKYNTTTKQKNIFYFARCHKGVVFCDKSQAAQCDSHNPNQEYSHIFILVQIYFQQFSLSFFSFLLLSGCCIFQSFSFSFTSYSCKNFIT